MTAGVMKCLIYKGGDLPLPRKDGYLMLLAGVLGLLLFARGNSTAAQEPPACPAEVGCAEITLSPNTLLGDFFLNEQLLAAGQNHIVLQVPPAQQNQIV